MIGQSISDSGGDFWTVVYRARATGDISGEFADGAFFIPNSAVTGFPCLVSGLVDGDTPSTKTARKVLESVTQARRVLVVLNRTDETIDSNNYYYQYRYAKRDGESNGRNGKHQPQPIREEEAAVLN